MTTTSQAPGVARYRVALTTRARAGTPPRASLATSNPADVWRVMAEGYQFALAAGGAFIVFTRDAHALASEAALTVEERARVEGFRRPERRLGFVLGRTLVRALADASVPVPIRVGPKGKPFLTQGPHFSLSHADRYTAGAFCRTAPIGIDVETGCRVGELRALVALMAHPDEARRFQACADAALPRLFRLCWTRKEAALKAFGSGLQCDPRTVDVRPGELSPVIRFPETLRLVDVWNSSDEVGAAVALGIDVEPLVGCWIDGSCREPSRQSKYGPASR